MNRAVILNDWDLELLKFILYSNGTHNLCKSMGKELEYGLLCDKIAEALGVKK